MQVLMYGRGACVRPKVSWSLSQTRGGPRAHTEVSRSTHYHYAMPDQPTNMP